ncbi:MAG: 2-dehydropantoate 2-reductase [Rhodomicrobium sp.]
MRIAIIGAGAMGSVYAGLLAHAGLDVWAIDIWDEHIAAIKKNGLKLSGASGDRVAALPASTDVADAGPVDLAIIATKAYDVEAAAASVKPVLSPEASVLTIQNGLGSAERVAAIVGADRVLIGVVGGFGASIPAPGEVHHNGWEFVRLGEFSGGLTPRLAMVSKLWEKAGFKVLEFPDIHRMIWEKLICNIAFSGPCTLTGLTIGEACENPDAFQISAACATEAFLVARAKGAGVNIDDPVAYVREFGSKIPQARPSMLLDHMAGRRSEIDVINGAASRLGAELGVPTPVNSTVVALVRAREAAFIRSR